MLKNHFKKSRDYQFRSGIEHVPAGIKQYKSMGDTPVFIITTDGSFYRLHTFSSLQLKRLDCTV